MQLAVAKATAIFLIDLYNVGAKFQHKIKSVFYQVNN